MKKILVTNSFSYYRKIFMLLYYTIKHVFRDYKQKGNIN